LILTVLMICFLIFVYKMACLLGNAPVDIEPKYYEGAVSSLHYYPYARTSEEIMQDYLEQSKQVWKKQ